MKTWSTAEVIVVGVACGALGAMLYRSWVDARAVRVLKERHDAREAKVAEAKAKKERATQAPRTDPLSIILHAQPGVATPIRNLPMGPNGSNAPANFYG